MKIGGIMAAIGIFVLFTLAGAETPRLAYNIGAGLGGFALFIIGGALMSRWERHHYGVIFDSCRRKSRFPRHFQMPTIGNWK